MVVGFDLNGGGFGSAMGLGLRWVSALMVGGLGLWRVSA